MPSARSRSTARTPCLPAPMEAEGTGPSSLHSSRPANSTASIRKPISQTSSRASQACPYRKVHPRGLRCGRPNRVTLSPHGRDAQDRAGDAALAVPVALPAPGRDPRPSATTHRLAPYGAEARPPQGGGPAAVRAALSALARRLGFGRRHPTGHDRALAPTWLQSLMAVEVPTPSWETPHSQRHARSDPRDHPRQSALGSTPRSWRAAQTRDRCLANRQWRSTC